MRLLIAALTAVVLALGAAASASAQDLTPFVAIAQPDPHQPGVVIVDVQAATPMSGTVSFRRLGSTGPYRQVPGQVRGQQLVAYLPVRRLRSGRYELLAVVQTVEAGQLSTTTNVFGAPVYLDIARRTKTRLRTDNRLAVGHVVRGRLSTKRGRPLARRTITLQRRAVDARAWRTITRARTDRRGRFAIHVQRFTGASARVRVRFAGSLRLRPAQVSRLVRKRARARLGVNRSTVRLGQQLVLRGRVTSKPLPRRGARVVLQALDQGRWYTMAQLRTDRRGRFSYPYRFQRSRGVFTYPFRAVIPRQRGLLYKRGYSNRAYVTVDGRGRR